MSTMLLPVLKNRPARLISCEQEISDGYEWVAQQLYDNKIIDEPGMGGSPYWPFIAHIKDDCTADAEIVYKKLQLDKASYAAKFQKAMGIINDGVNKGEVDFNDDVGFHVHVGIGGCKKSSLNYSSSDVESLYNLWCFLEDPIYRIASAGYDYHRTDEGNDYALAVEKLYLKGMTKSEKAEELNNLYRDCGLNLTNYTEVASRCTSYLTGDWNSCQCRYGHSYSKPTAEFRVFNGTYIPKYANAYTALSLALVSAAKKTNYKQFQRAPLPYQGVDKMPHSKELWKRIQFMFKVLPLTNYERWNLISCMRNSSLKKMERAGYRFDSLVSKRRKVTA